ncbi:MAG: diacylglycerol kinase family protein [Desulfobacterales bacterium]
MSSIAFIVNPRAGNGSTGLKWPAIKARARNRLGSFKSYVTTGAGEAKHFTEKAINSGARLVVCVGGDGTLNEVVNGFMEIGESDRSGLSLGFVPGGTGCDFIKTVSIPKDMEKAIDLIAAGTVRCIDLGRLFFKDHDGRDCRRYFLNITSFGLGGEVDQRVNKTTKAFGPFISFIWATLISILLYGKKKIRFKVDQSFEQELIIWNVVVANGQYHGGGMWVAPDASVDDGLFDITVIGDLSLPEVFLNLPKLYNGKIKDIDKVITLTGEKIEALSDQRVLLDVDGEQPGMLPVDIDIVPGALKIITAQ